MRLSNFHIGKFYPLRAIASVYVDIIRGTPVVVQLVIMYYIHTGQSVPIPTLLRSSLSA